MRALVQLSSLKGGGPVIKMLGRKRRVFKGGERAGSLEDMSWTEARFRMWRGYYRVC